jgi:hypothetical protein
MSLEDITATLEGRQYIPPHDGARFIGGAAMSAEAWPRRTKNRIFSGPDPVKRKATELRRRLRRKLMRRGHDNDYLLTLDLEKLERMLEIEMRN